MKPTLRFAREEDIPELLAIEADSFTHPRWSGPDFLKYPCTIAEMDGEIAGFLVHRETFPGNAQTRAEREILNIAVAPRFRRRGIANLLLGHELASGCSYFLEVRESNVAAQTLYRKFGFEEVGRRKKYYANPPETAIVMRVK